jgi:SAM-dependent methyltransferase
MANPYDYRVFPKTFERHDFWRQVGRTVNGEPVPPEQIQMIVDAIKSALVFSPADVVLDLACGNGALSSRFYDSCRDLHGVDRSDYLIGVAKEYFERIPHYTYETADVGEFLESHRTPNRYTKCLCYGSFAYFSRELTDTVLRILAERFRSVSRVFIGNLPNRLAAPDFFRARDIDFKSAIDEPDSPIGLWWDQGELRKLATESGWLLELRTMPKEFFGSHYRFDVVLIRP